MGESRIIIEQHQPLWGCWFVDAFIGQGSHGSVYRVKREELGHRYTAAVKLISIPTEAQLKDAITTMGNDAVSLLSYFEEMAEQTAREISLLHQLTGQAHVLTYQDHLIIKRPNEMKWDVFIRMEYAQSLPQFLQTQPFSEADIVRLGIDVCTALEACSKRGILHRDIKEDNIFVSSDGTFKLGDFGVAREAFGTNTVGTVLGTPQYMAPEISRGERYSETVDLYALGIVMFKLLNAGRLPFMPPSSEPVKYGNMQEALLKRLRGEEIPLPSEASPALGAVVKKACDFRSVERFQNATEMKQALQALDLKHALKQKSEKITPLSTKHRVNVFYGIMVSCLMIFLICTFSFINKPNISNGSSTIIFDDHALETIVRKIVGKPHEPVLVSDVSQIHRLDLSERGIHNLHALQYFTELETLNLSHNIIADLTPLKELKRLIRLDLSENRISSLAGLETLTDLEVLSLDDNVIKDVGALQALKALLTLNISRNQVEDLQALVNLKALTTLDLSQNQIRELTDIRGLLRLEKLNINQNAVESLEALSDLKQLLWLDCGDNRIYSLDTLRDVFGLEYLDASGNDIERFGTLDEHTRLQHLNLSDNPLTLTDSLIKLKVLNYLDLSHTKSFGIESVGSLTTLTTLKLDGHAIGDLAGVAELKALEHLSLGGCQMKSIESIEALTMLKSLNLSGNALVELNGIHDLEELIALDVSQNQVESLEPMSGLVKLKQLNVSNNHLTDLTPLNGLMDLRELKAEANVLTELGALKRLTALKLLDLSHNQIQSIEVLAKLKELETLDLAENQIRSIQSLSNLNLIALYLNDNQVLDYGPLAEQSSLRYLTLSHNENVHYDALSLLAPRLIEKDFE